MNFSKLMAKKGKGFTLVEILVVILIIGLLFVFLVPKISSATDKARETGVKTDFHSYEIAIESVAKENSGLGKAGFGSTATAATVYGKINDYLDPALKICVEDETPADAVVGDCAKKDPWNNVYKAAATVEDGNEGNVTITSYGKDGATAGGDDYVLTVEQDTAGTLTTTTTGFSKNIE